MSAPDRSLATFLTGLRFPLALVFVSLLLVSSARGEDGDFIPGKSTMAEVQARFGTPSFENTRSLAYYAREMRAPYPAWLQELRSRDLMVVFEFDESGLFVRRFSTHKPSP